VLITNVVTAELTKYAANAFLATKISFINEFANLCEEIGADVHDIARGIGLDRGSAEVPAPGPGLRRLVLPEGHALDRAVRARDRQPARDRRRGRRRERAPAQRMVEKIAACLDGDVAGKTIGVLGLSFKPETDDTRDSPALAIVRALQARGRARAGLRPAGDGSRRARSCPSSRCAATPIEACRGAEALVIVTEWNQFRMLDLERHEVAARAAGARRSAQHLRPGRDARGRLRIRLRRALVKCPPHASRPCGDPRRRAGERFWGPRSRRGAAKAVPAGAGQPGGLLDGDRRAARAACPRAAACGWCAARSTSWPIRAALAPAALASARRAAAAQTLLAARVRVRSRCGSRPRIPKR
jgi:hypothetical protein